MPISNFTVVLKYLQSRASYDSKIKIEREKGRWEEKIHIYIYNNVSKGHFKVLSQLSQFSTYRSNKMSRYIIIQSPQITIEFISGCMFHRCYRRMITCIVAFLWSIDSSCYYLANFFAPFRTILLLF